MIKGIRGASTAGENTAESIRETVLELLDSMIAANGIEKKNISHVIFTLTKDLDAVFPAQFARVELGWDDIAMMCFNELDVEGSLEKCLRVLIVLNCADDFVPRYVYLKDAAKLR
ncbi:MAG: chorismate mutase [Heliobacteriaceae bacterium]|jgi:chorismate mutase|nr:chorismate mutase [Heliobacteriaceae bacterium]